jgi:2-hydroxychromene-2-carboxylate isomerase
MFEQITKFANETSDTLTSTVTDAINDTNISERFTTTSDQVLDAVLDANRRIVDMAVTTADRVAEQINVELPFADRFPTPTVAGERYLEFVERAVSLNRDMNQRVAEMIKVDNVKAASEKVVATTKTVAQQAPAKKAPARKTVAKKRPAARKTATRKTATRKTAAKKAAASK